MPSPDHRPSLMPPRRHRPSVTPSRRHRHSMMLCLRHLLTVISSRHRHSTMSTRRHRHSAMPSRCHLAATDIRLPTRPHNLLRSHMHACTMMHACTYSCPRAAQLSQLGDPHGSGDKPHVPAPLTTISGVTAWLTWRFAYWGTQVSVANKILIPMHWFKTFVFGRDISRF